MNFGVTFHSFNGVNHLNRGLPSQFSAAAFLSVQSVSTQNFTNGSYRHEPD